ncbi:hypothetical protein F3H65_18465 [Klebsiella quasipneumoniae]|uniref:hypothetical protein n=1 Tax=Klebsiella quasipneumoniae TaxID=1463165 RepID=UPI0017DF3A07|nr:hypothetical protein [Klebsiella quasipneumoniae]ECN3190607.1 hypothetical protein [Salmonella enterica subsp. enterica serovar Newport]EFG6493112.1 hypothetical protein [Escherichia coli]EIZ8887153.1 hypothetical protein [Shigella flexneri]HCS7701982.1 hypothetical protein [Salmonella enterica subsp. enterica serovar Typhimurium]EFI4676443.1 hypothetical protein [Escherichia coli]
MSNKRRTINKGIIISNIILVLTGLALLANGFTAGYGFLIIAFIWLLVTWGTETLFMFSKKPQTILFKYDDRDNKEDKK